MLISHRRRFIYTKTVKTGGTSVEAYFEPECLPPGEWRPVHNRDETVSAAGVIGYRGPQVPPDCRWWNHMPAAMIRERLGEELWSAYFKFCVVRNPFEKAISAYYFLGRPAPSAEAIDLDRERARFEEWLATSGPPIDRDKYVMDGRFCLDRVIRHESLTADLAAVCERLGLAWEPARLPRFKSGVRPAHATVAALYTPRSRALVEQAYAWELEHFGYEFPAE
jgi:hypothetical protein